MREVKLSNGETVSVRGLRRSEIKSLSQYGIGYMRCEVYHLNGEDQDKAIDAVLATQFKEGELEVENSDLLEVFNAICKETWSSRQEEKNSLRSGPSDQTAPEESTAEHA